MIGRGFDMEKGVDYVDNFSPTPGLAVARLMMSLAIANDMELHKIDIDPGVDKRNKLSGWVDSDFTSDIDTRKSMTGYLMVLNGGSRLMEGLTSEGGHVEQ
jgi:hypothetical protein